jgi:hypothetical protein
VGQPAEGGRVTIFTLAVYSCVTIMMWPGTDLRSKTCDWNGRGMYSSREKCEAAAPKDGDEVFSDVADGRKVEKHSCNEMRIN